MTMTRSLATSAEDELVRLDEEKDGLPINPIDKARSLGGEIGDKRSIRLWVSRMAPTGSKFEVEKFNGSTTSFCGRLESRIRWLGGGS